jgi:hypothetical protein
MPASTAGRDSRAPWRKNSSAIATSLPIATSRAPSPLHGSSSASPTTPTMASVKPSRRKRRNLPIGHCPEFRP